MPSVELTPLNFSDGLIEVMDNDGGSGDLSDDLNGDGDGECCGDCSPQDGVGLMSPDSQNFTIKEKLYFTSRFEEGYDLFDPKYEEWLDHYHPESAGKLLSLCQSVVFHQFLSRPSLLLSLAMLLRPHPGLASLTGSATPSTSGSAPLTGSATLSTSGLLLSLVVLLCPRPGLLLSVVVLLCPHLGLLLSLAVLLRPRLSLLLSLAVLLCPSLRLSLVVLLQLQHQLTVLHFTKPAKFIYSSDAEDW